jgi:transposase
VDRFFEWLGPAKRGRIELAVMDMWKAFRTSTARNAPDARILFDKVHVLRHLSDALGQVRKNEYKRLSDKDRRFIKGQKYTLLSHRENLTTEGRRALTTLLAANKRLHTAELLKESFGQLWDYRREGWARRFFENWRAALKWQRLKPYEEFCRDDRATLGWDRRVLQPGQQRVTRLRRRRLNNKIRVLQRRALGSEIRVPSPEDPDVDAPGTVGNRQNHPHEMLKTQKKRAVAGSTTALD